MVVGLGDPKPNYLNTKRGMRLILSVKSHNARVKLKDVIVQGIMKVLIPPSSLSKI